MAHKNIIIALFVCLFLTSPVMAGEASYIDMRGRWISTKCTPPQAPSYIKINSESAANDVNTKAMQHNQFVQAARAYMDCLADEGNRDAQAMGQLVSESVSILMNDMNQKVEQSRFYINKMQGSR